MLTQLQIDFYHENGYLGVEGVFTAKGAVGLQQATDELVKKACKVTEHTSLYDLEPGHSP